MSGVGPPLFDFIIEHQPEYRQLNLYNATSEALKEFVYPPYVETLLILSGYMSHFEIPHGIKTVQIIRVGLRTITVPDSVVRLQCDDNFVRRLDLPHTIEYVEAPDNQIYEITFRGGAPTNLCELNVQNNCLMSLDFPPPSSLYHLDVYKNYYLRNMTPELMAIYRNSIDQEDHNLCVQLSGNAATSAENFL